MKLIVLHRVNGGKVWINVDHIAFVLPAPLDKAYGSEVRLACAPKEECFKEKPGEICAMIGPMS